MNYEIEEFNNATVTDQQIDRYHEFYVAVLAERLPDDPPPPIGAAVSALRDIAPNSERTCFAAVAGGRWIGVGLAIVPTANDDTSLRVDLAVLPEFRRQGIGSDLLRRVLAVGDAAGKTLLIGDTYDRIAAGTSFAERVGAQPGLRSHVNRLTLATVDRDMLDRWIDDGPKRAPGYELVGYDGRTPDDLVAQVADIINVMNDAPQDDLEVGIPRITVELFRSFEEAALASGTVPWWLFAREKSTGFLVGETDVRWHPSQPDALNQGFTVVRREHRGHALGKWLKGTMTKRVLEERPNVKHITTSNADSNDPMMGLNSELGYQPYIGTCTWQVALDTAETALVLT